MVHHEFNDWERKIPAKSVELHFFSRCKASCLLRLSTCTVVNSHNEHENFCKKIRKFFRSFCHLSEKFLLTYRWASTLNRSRSITTFSYKDSRAFQRTAIEWMDMCAVLPERSGRAQFEYDAWRYHGSWRQNCNEGKETAPSSCVRSPRDASSYCSNC